jgi:hypothetical protein
MEVIPRTAWNGYQNMQLMIVTKEYLIVVCKAHSVQYIFINKPKAVTSIIIYIIIVLFVLHWQG